MRARRPFNVIPPTVSSLGLACPPEPPRRGPPSPELPLLRTANRNRTVHLLPPFGLLLQLRGGKRPAMRTVETVAATGTRHRRRRGTRIDRFVASVPELEARSREPQRRAAPTWNAGFETEAPWLISFSRMTCTTCIVSHERPGALSQPGQTTQCTNSPRTLAPTELFSMANASRFGLLYRLIGSRDDPCRNSFGPGCQSMAAGAY